ncbi:MAG: hypothetical protein RR232_01660 [Clostridia bacterium]
MRLSRMEISAFESTAEITNGMSKHKRFTRVNHNKNRSTTQDNAGFSSMFIKIGICAAVCALVLVIKLIDDSAMTIYNSADSGTAIDEEFDESLGKLKFVALPGILDVFAPDGKLQLGFEYDSKKVLDDNSALCIFASKVQNIPIPVDCVVKEVSNIAETCVSVSITTEDDIEIVYRGLSKAAVEEGQRLTSGDTLGQSGENTLTIQVYLQGRPCDPMEVFDIASGDKM